MAGPGLPTTITAGATGHLAHSGASNAIVNQFDTTVTPTNGHVLVGNGSAFDNRALESTDIPGVVVNSQTGTAYTLVLADAGKLVERSNAAANTLTVPSALFSAGHVVLGRQYGAGVTTIVAGSGMTLRSRGGVLISAGQYAEWVITFRSASEAVVSGDLV